MSDLLTNLREVRRGWFLSFENEYTVSLPRANEIVGMVDEAATRISQQDDELERLRRDLAEALAINANLMGDDESVPRYTTKRLHHEIDRARKAAFIEAAEIAELDADWSAFGKKNLEPWDTGPDAVRDYRIGIVAGRAIAAAIRAKAEETRT